MKRVSASKVARWPLTITKWALVYACCFVLVGILSFGVCYAYFSAKTEAIGTIATGILQVEYVDADDEISSTLSTRVMRTYVDEEEEVEDNIIMPGDKINVLGNVKNTGTIDGYVILQAEFILMSEDESTEEKVFDSKFYNLDGTELDYNTTSKIYTTPATSLAKEETVSLINNNNSPDNTEDDFSNIIYTVNTGLTSQYSGRTFKLRLTIHAYQAENLIHDSEKYTSLEIQATNEMLTDISRLVTNFKISGNVVTSTAVVLPAEYQQVEYIQNDGTSTLQYIDTGVVVSENNSYEAKAQLVHVNNTSQTVWGGRASATAGALQSNQLSFVKSASTYQFVSGNTAMATTAWDNNVHTFYADKNKLYVDNTLLYTATSSAITESNNVYLFATNTAGTAGFGGGSLKMYYCKIWQNDTLVRHYIPCYRKSDNVVGLYDLITNEFYTNSGSGQLTASKSVKYLPAEYQQVEYIESTGTQYIDTGVIPSNTVGFKIKMELPEVASDTFRFGCRQDAGNTRFVLGTSNGVVYFGFNTIISGTWTIKANTSFEGSLNYLNSRVANVNNANDQQLSDISTNFTYPLIMFGRNSAGTISSSAQKIYSCKITDGSEIVRDFIPCYRIADNVIGMYDKVNDVFYTNGGTGEFLKGNDVNGSVNAPVKFNWVGEKTKNLLKSTDNVYGTITPTTGAINKSYKWATTTDYFPLKAGTYMISYNSGINLRNIVIFNGSKEWLNYFWSARANPYKFTLDLDCLVRIDFERANNANIENLDTFYEEFEVLLTDDLSSRIYEPYNKYKVTINGRAEGKNLMPSSVLDKNAYGYGYELEHPTVYTLPTLEAGKIYTLSFDYEKGGTTFYYFRKYKDGTRFWVTDISGAEHPYWPLTNSSTTGKYSITFKAEENATYFFYGNAITYLEPALTSISNVQLEEGDTATEYVPHNSANHTFFLDEPLRKVGDVADEIVWENGQFVVKRRTGEIVFTGDESWGLYNGGTFYGISEGKSFYILNSEWKIGTQTSICSHYQNINSSWAGAYNDRLGIYSDHPSTASKYFRAPDSSITTLYGFKAWLKEQYNLGRAITLAYQLAEAKEEILNIDQMFTLAGETNYTIDTTVQPSDYYIS